jgi:pimeloyl-ACP methyl ester carboxylesterase
MKRIILSLIVLSMVCTTPLLPVQSSVAQDYTVSLVETGKTPGFDPPTLFLYPSYFTDFLLFNRSMQEPYLINTNPELGEVGESLDYGFMTRMIFNEVRSFSHLIDPYDNPEYPSPGYRWDMKIFHPGSTPGKLPPHSSPYPVIIFCTGASGSDPQYYNSMDWMGTYYAQQGYIFAIPTFIGNDANFSETPYYEISSDIYALQTTLTVSYLDRAFTRLNKGQGRIVDTSRVTLIGISFGGHVAQKCAVMDPRIARLCLLSSVFIYYQDAWLGFLLDTKDTYDILNRTLRGMALHVQRFTAPPYILPCPDWDPECDWIPPVDGYLTQVDLTLDPWEPTLCNGEPCGVRDGTYYNYNLYSGPKQDEIKNNNLLAHSGAPDSNNQEAGQELTLQYLDEFFAEFPLR